MTEYICRDKVLSYVYATHSAGGFRNEEDYLWLQEAVVDAAAADVKPVKHGKWEEVTDYGGWGDTHYRCSVCGEEWYLEDGKPKDNNMNFCPRCGARMDKEGDNGKFD